jgi:hypothetical protein
VVPALSDALRTACAPLPALVLLPGEQLDMRPALLRNRALADMVHKECAARHAGVVKAVGATVIQPPEVQP